MYETDLHRLYLEAVNSMIRDKANVLKEMEQRLKAASDTSALMNERQQLEQDVQELERTMNSLSQENARIALDQAEFSQQYRELYVTAQEKHARLTEIATELREHVAQAEMIRQFVQQLTDMADEQTVFDEQQWAHMIDHVTVYTKARIVFTFLGGYEVERELPQKRTYRT